MKKYSFKFIAALMVLGSFLMSCGNSTDNKSKEQKEIVSNEEHNHDDESEAIEFNNGEKWHVDTNMIIHIQNMENDVVFFAKADRKDYKVLSSKLQANIDLLTSNCTMKGQAHDELHKWLLPYIDLVEALSEANDETEAKLHFENIQNSFKTFNNYFQ